MSVEFDSDQHNRSILYAKLLQPSDTTPSLINWLTKKGIAKTPEGANRILIIVMILSFALTGFTVFKNVSSNSNRLTPAEQRYNDQLNKMLEMKRIQYQNTQNQNASLPSNYVGPNI
jgi:hypothetical protein